MGASQREKSDGRDYDGRSDDTSRCIKKREKHIGNRIHHRWRRVAHAFYCDIADLGRYSQEADELRRSSGVDFVLRQRPKPYISRKLFLEYIKTLFVPYLNELLDFEEFEA
jgi:hypothetical protein